jgi:peptidoglycan/LPS O-acetylase OafA/YrhL
MFNDFLDLKKPFTYRRDIDGLRALAVLPVILFHAGLGFPGGYVGVDIFFVISGYLITSIVIRDILNERFNYADFWERRIRRIFPAALFVTAISVLFGAFALLPDAYRALGKAAMSQLTMVANFYFWQQDGYFAGPSDLEPLLHMWSLAVEEQYYLLFPFLLVTITRRKKLKAKNVILILTLLSLAWSLYGVIYYQMATFYLLPARAWELLLGSLLALSPMDLKTTRLRRNLLALTGLSLIPRCFCPSSLYWDSLAHYRAFWSSDEGEPTFKPLPGGLCRSNFFFALPLALATPCLRKTSFDPRAEYHESYLPASCGGFTLHSYLEVD